MTWTPCGLAGTKHKHNSKLPISRILGIWKKIERNKIARRYLNMAWEVNPKYQIGLNLASQLYQNQEKITTGKSN